MAGRITGLKQISTGWYHIRGIGPCNWVQTPEWPATEAVIREHAFPEASEEFIKLVIEAAEHGSGTTSAKPGDQRKSGPADPKPRLTNPTGRRQQNRNAAAGRIR